MSRKIEAVIFDWAGTTVDYGCFAPVEAFVEAFKAYGITPTIEEVRKPMGMLKWDHIKTMMEMPRINEEWKRVHQRDWTKEDVDAVYETSETSIMKILHRFAEPKPYVLDTVKALRERGIKIGSTTGYTDEMMSIVVPKAEEQGYKADCWFSPNAVKDMGRPYPYMIFKNLETLKVSSIDAAIKIGDTVADIKEGKSAGMISVGIVEGSSIMALTEEAYQALTEEEKEAVCQKVRETYEAYGADYILQNMSELMDLIHKLEA